jgi:hypothetical protein
LHWPLLGRNVGVAAKLEQEDLTSIMHTLFTEYSMVVTVFIEI